MVRRLCKGAIFSRPASIRSHRDLACADSSSTLPISCKYRTGSSVRPISSSLKLPAGWESVATVPSCVWLDPQTLHFNDVDAHFRESVITFDLLGRGVVRGITAFSSSIVI